MFSRMISSGAGIDRGYDRARAPFAVPGRDPQNVILSPGAGIVIVGPVHMDVDQLLFACLRLIRHTSLRRKYERS